MSKKESKYRIVVDGNGKYFVEENYGENSTWVIGGWDVHSIWDNSEAAFRALDRLKKRDAEARARYLRSLDRKIIHEE